jgi:hypothetical protein
MFLSTGALNCFWIQAAVSFAWPPHGGLSLLPLYAAVFFQRIQASTRGTVIKRPFPLAKEANGFIS